MASVSNIAYSLPSEFLLKSGSRSFTSKSNYKMQMTEHLLSRMARLKRSAS